MIATENIKNGVNVDQLVATVNAVQENPALAKFEFRAKNEWLGGGYCRTKVKEFYGVGEEDSTRKEEFVMEADHPAVLLGNDYAANPAEIVLHALSSCLTAAITYHAAALGIEIEDISSELKGGADLQGFLGLDPNVRKGLESINVKFRVKSDASEEQLRELSKFSPVFDMISNPTPVNIEFEK